MNLNKPIVAGVFLIGLYLVVANATGFGRAVGAGGDATVSVVKAFQGRG